MRLHNCLLLLAMTLAGCASRPVAVEVAAPAPLPPPLPPAPPPNGAAAGLTIPQPLPDGSYPTPNRQLAATESVWHLRAALNVAALLCTGADSPQLVAGYNRLLATRRAELARGQAASLAAAGSRDAHDAAMTRLYNFFAQPPAQAGFCAQAAAVTAALDGKTPLAEVAPGALAALDRPFTDFYRDYAAWSAQRVTLALAAPAPVTPAVDVAGPRIAYDPAVFAAP